MTAESAFADVRFDLVRKAASAAGLPSGGAVPIRLAENDLWRIPKGVVVRIARAGQSAAAAREVAVTRWLATQGVPAVRPLDLEQPVHVAGRAATFWEELPPHRSGTSADLAPLLRRLHDLPPPSTVQLDLMDPFVRVAERITAARSVGEDDREFLLARLDELRHAWAGLPDGQPLCVIHGDAWGGNCAVTEDGQRYLLDFERVSQGRREWDLTSTAVAVDTFGTLSDEEYERFCAAYGYDVRSWDGYPVMRDVRELRLVSFALQTADQHAGALEQAQHRLACVRGLRGPRPWHWRAVP
ncbi:phosphotransferase family protein [Streptomyces qinzhouensis]|uniref:Aminoglycoside phosphotransferase family protein n=1 Tax=Streptomyces qinzhouensis TaxID=2599401 RepID=A0A5B8J8I5_9ACTN|nr:aminoglycoside phosphotransferase family protein [Streptomyces qinzhouensis]QDY78145.1 aminoglycoside phosphotransferase family protein [Streptomyces qinzhouensis]